MDCVVEESVVCLRKFYPARSKKFLTRRMLRPDDCAIRVINLARLVGEVRLLPVAFFDCCQIKFKVADGGILPNGD